MIHQSISDVATKVSYITSSGTVIFGLSQSEWTVIGVVGGIILGAITASVNWYYRRKRDKREERRFHE